jgi:Cu2+-exporting ATPase
LLKAHRPAIFVFDKTGTLTEGILHLRTADYFCTPSTAMPIAQSLAWHAGHPVAKALLRQRGEVSFPVADIDHERGGGIAGTINGCRYFLGNRRFIARHCCAPLHFPETNDTEVFLAHAQGLLAHFTFADQLKKEAKALITVLRQQGVRVIMLSGDTPYAVQAVARDLGIEEAFAAMSPEDKYAAVAKLKQNGHAIAMMGDGINDAPALALADCSFSIAKGADLAKLSADIVLLRDHLLLVEDFFALSHKTRRIVQQNIVWAIGYNLLAVPWAASGLLLPWVAAIGMSLSSLLVTLNALRLRKD